MAFSSFGTPSMGSPTPAAIGGVQNGPDLETIQTEAWQPLFPLLL